MLQFRRQNTPVRPANAIPAGPGHPPPVLSARLNIDRHVSDMQLRLPAGVDHLRPCLLLHWVLPLFEVSCPIPPFFVFFSMVAIITPDAPSPRVSESIECVESLTNLLFVA